MGEPHLLAETASSVLGSGRSQSRGSRPGSECALHGCVLQGRRKKAMGYKWYYKNEESWLGGITSWRVGLETERHGKGSRRKKRTRFGKSGPTFFFWRRENWARPNPELLRSLQKQETALLTGQCSVFTVAKALSERQVMIARLSKQGPSAHAIEEASLEGICFQLFLQQSKNRE